MTRNIRARLCTVASALAFAASATITTCTTITPAYGADQLLCCDQVANANNPTVQGISAALGVDLSNAVGEIGLRCTAVGPAGAAGNCTGQPVQCAHNNFDGILATGCKPVDANR
ncbi:hydrophobin family protein [Streptomyces sp. NPDC049577]|uniref:hydrophobin family protein n=1 Tax=Streptomyces sp. NPDC049577 TaxID=3155153 RepID=UPI0034177C3E